MELTDYLRVLRKYWVLIVALVLVGVAAAAAYSLAKTPEYSSSAKVFVSTQSSDNVSDLTQGNTYSQQRVKTYVNLVSTPIVLQPVIAALELNITAGQLGGQVSAVATPDTTIIQITATSEDPVLAAELANTTAESLTGVVAKIESTDDGATSPVKLTRVQEANVPTTPGSPNVPLNLALGVLVGLALGVAFAVLRETLDTRIRNERDIEGLTEIPIMGGIAFDPKAKQRPLIVQADPKSPRAESFRSLRTNLQFLDVSDQPRSYVVTSSIQSEGKSTTAANLAIALADAGHRVIIIDADLRRPKLATYFDLEGAVGLSDVLIRRATLEDTMQPWGRGALTVLPAGAIPPNPSELLGSSVMQKLISGLEKQFDYVLIDAPPLLPVTDGALLARHTGGALVVVAAGRTHKNQLKGALEALVHVNASVAGLVMTMVPTKGPDAYGYARYGYGAGYGYTEDVKA
ncbi:polysaccharide biosynthesis tyrosine autokinase [Plantibacter sp. MCCC 1A11337]|uniref:polysaccharide biosynthesis tyrosine autokinase n=1 Tax=Plantibacter TaxID=190323 RepID=UPI00099CE09E|nr:polysaccharide biosynthesis tyrosine autokinase [Plantibacter flavus]AQX81146.1 chromosome partitioning protein [Plantibacter flavus]NUJ89002.1 polysaccharide biosynthesis tyrosine autokinase [Plantibacter sp. MCCC 1A11337]